MKALDRLDCNLQAARPGEDWDGSEFSGGNQLGMGDGAQALLQDIAELEQLAEQLSQSYAGAAMDDVDLDALARQLGDEAADRRPHAGRARAGADEPGLPATAAPTAQWRLSPKAMRQLGKAAAA